MNNYPLKLSVLILNILILCLFNKAWAFDYAKERANSDSILKVINADIAHSQGYTGKGITVGVIDTPLRADHAELLGKVSIFNTGTPTSLSWAANMHAAHVSGIIAANKDGYGMYGVAYDANLHSGALVFETGQATTNYPFSINDFFASNPSMRVVNNSWGAPKFAVSANETTGLIEELPPATYFSIFNSFLTSIIDYSITNPQILMVFAAGNSGYMSPSVEPLMPYYVGPELNNIINVGGINSAHVERNSNGELILNTKSLYEFSNLATKVHRYTVMAPGQYVYSLYSGDNGYKVESGTSMAAPAVSGAAALVVQKYPWLTGKQVADTILSNANSNFQYTNGAGTTDALTDGDIFIVFEDAFGPTNIVFYTVDDSGNSRKKDLTKAEAQAILTSLNTSLDLDDFDEYYTMYITRAEIFGRGILDVGKALNGTSLLDANRMTKDNVFNIDGTDYALEIFDTQGYSAIFSNDIGEEKWVDAYHQADYRTGAIDGQHADALSGKDVGLMKTGAGTLILSGENTYTGATVIAAGILGLMPRADGTGGEITNSDVYINSQGRLWSQGGTIGQTLYNGGTLYIESDAGNALTVDTYVPTANSTLMVEFDSTSQHGQIFVTNAPTLAGTLEFIPEAMYYTNNLQVSFDIFSTAINGDFASYDVEQISPTLSMSVQKTNADQYTLNLSRAQNTYAQYASTTAANKLGLALGQIAGFATGDMQNLIMALDFSNPTGQDVKKALNQLGPESYNTQTQASLNQQSNINTIVLQRLLASSEYNFMASKAQNSGLAAGSNSALRPMQIWGQAIGSSISQGSYDNISGYNTNSVGLVAGFDYTWNSSLITGVHMAFVKSNSSALGDHDSNTDTDSFSLGLQAHYAPEQWDGFYIMGLGRIGFDQNTKDRTVTIGTYSRSNMSEWTDFVTSFMGGGGKDWAIDNWRVGPMAWLEFSHLQRPNISETGGQATSLNLEATSYSSLRSALGLHAGYAKKVSENLDIDFDILGLWKHELLDGSSKTKASFAGYNNTQFTSETPLLGRNSYGLQTSLRLTHKLNHFVQLDLGGEVNDANGHGVFFGLKFGYNF